MCAPDLLPGYQKASYMTDYQALRIDITNCTEAATDLLAAFLADAGYESFVPDDNGLTAYIVARDFSRAAVDDILAAFPMPLNAKVSVEHIEGQDWNSEWEKHYFQPIVVGGECVIHSTFHTDVPKARYDIVIDPKMAFGTGHHATTSLIIEYLLDIPLEGKSVIDMGTGTGILAILCHKRGSAPVTGIEIDEAAWENAVDNARINDASAVHMIHGDAHALQRFAMLDSEPDMHADLLLANINRNIILNDLELYAKALKPGGTMILSGFYVEDAPLIDEAGAVHGMERVELRSRDKWCAIKLQKR